MFRYIATLFIMLCFSNNIYAQEDLSNILARLEAKVAKVDSIEADFKQKRKLAVFKKELLILGTTAMQKPDRFAWHVKSPLESIMVIDGVKLRQWDKETGKTNSISLKKNPAFKAAVAQMRMWFSGEYSALLDQYDMQLMSDKPVKLYFKPKKDSHASKLFDAVEVTFREDEKYLSSLKIEELKGDYIYIEFDNVKLNSEIEEKTWL